MKKSQPRSSAFEWTLCIVVAMLAGVISLLVVTDNYHNKVDENLDRRIKLIEANIDVKFNRGDSL